MPTKSTGRLADPVWRHERAKKAAAARNAPEYHLERIREAVAASRAAQGLPPVVVDELTLARVADLIGTARKEAA